MFPAAQRTIDRLEDARQRWWVFSLLCNVVLVVVLSLGTFSLFVFGDLLLSLPRLGLAILLGLWCTLSIVFLFGTVYRSLRRQRSLVAVARRVELSCPQLGSHLINLVQLAEPDGGVEADPFREAAVREAAAQVEAVPFTRAAEQQGRWARWKLGIQTPRDLIEFSAILFLVLGLLYAFSIVLPNWTSSTSRLFAPWRDIPRTGAVQILEVQPGDAELLIGARLEITARAVLPPGSSATASPAMGKVLITHADGSEETVPMLSQPVEDEAAEDPSSPADPLGQTRFTGRLPAVLRPLAYRLVIGDSETRTYRITVRDKPTVRQVEVRYEYPGYLRRGEETVEQKHADLRAAQYSTAHLRIHSSSLLSRGHVQVGSRKIHGRVEDDQKTLAMSLPMLENTGYTIHLFDELGHTDPDPRVNRLSVVVDQPPGVQLVKPDRKSTATPRGLLPAAIRARDDQGLGEVRLEWKGSDPESPRQAQATDRPESVPAANSDTSRLETAVPEAAASEAAVPEVQDAEPPRTLQRWADLPAPTATTMTHEIKLGGLTAEGGGSLEAGQSLWIRAVAVDRRRVRMAGVRLDPQVAVGAWHRVRLVSAEQAASEQLEQFESLTAQLWAILQAQLRARIATTELGHRSDLPAALELATDIGRRQVRVQTESDRLAESIVSTEDHDQLTVKQTLNRLAHGEMLQAVRQAEQLKTLPDMNRLSAAALPLGQTQDRIIEALRRLLETMRRATSESLAHMEDRPGGDLPDDVRDKLEGLLDKLDEFLQQQRRVIEATKELAKKPVEDFTEEEQQLLQKLAAVEDDWARFLEDARSDFSKLPEQDFANPSLLEELIEVQTEIKMAADALTKKTADIAVPLEQLGAEMAEELATNIEKWLPDTPDRERWSQEEPLTDEMKEAPMAELPGELEDLVGELMEEEEDLFDEMEDISSSWADSLDKGAGWDAADGPISNMSAKGVTGNRLPNTSEIGGRSGEGRQGKASGEFVGDTAVGKGGRKTPSRLAPDPFVKGQVKDLSKDPVGGATGGGKESGVGGEGLEGPVPRQARRELDRMATRQAELRNRAEAIDLKFQVLDYHHTDLQKLMQMMAAVEHDLRGGRYQSALRRREVMLEGLGSVKSYLEGEFQVRRDRTSNLPEDIQKDLLGGMQEASPAGWERLNRQYFERLSGESK